MKKITKRIIKYLVIINLAISIVGFGLITYLLPNIYNNNEFNDLENTSNYVLESLDKGYNLELANITAVLLKNGEIINIHKVTSSNRMMGHGGMMMGQGMMGVNQLNPSDLMNLKERDIFNSKNGQSYISYKRSTSYGDLIVYKSYSGTKQLIKSVNIIMITILIMSLLISTILAIYMGNKLAKPIIVLKSRAENISKGIYKGEYIINTNDEIEDLSKSISEMAKELEIKDNMQREFIANVSHDLKTPLSIIRANGEVINDGLVSGEEVKEYSKNIINEVDSLNLLVGEILELSKIKDNKKIIKKKLSSLNEFLENSYYKLVNQYITINPQEVKYNLDINVDNIENLYIEIDENYLFRVLQNLFNNAKKHAKNNNKITLYIKEISNGVKVGIKDYGEGIEEEKLKYIWDRYYKDDKSGGMGLGLAISKEIILAHGFDLGVESKINYGSEFYFIIPQNLIIKK
ncbi:HAMP domain-containing sensor histidine kinase [Clostridium carnis]